MTSVHYHSHFGNFVVYTDRNYPDYVYYFNSSSHSGPGYLDNVAKLGDAYIFSINNEVHVVDLCKSKITIQPSGDYCQLNYTRTTIY